MNNSKNKLNSKISWQLSSMPNAHIVLEKDIMEKDINLCGSWE